MLKMVTYIFKSVFLVLGLLLIFQASSYAGKTIFGDLDVEGNLTVSSITGEGTGPAALIGSFTVTDNVGIGTTSPLGVLDIGGEIIYVDSVSEIQPAINALEAGYGGTIHIATGIYDLEDTGLTISGTATITIIGSGTGRAGMGTRIESSAGIDLITIGTSSTENDDCEINISNLRLYGDYDSRPASGSGLRIINQSAGINISNVYFDYNYVGMVIEAEGVDNSSYDNSVYSCTFKHNESAYVIRTVDAGGTNFCNVNQVTDSQFENNDLCVSMTTVPGSSEIAHNYFKGCNFDTQQVTQKLLYMDGDVQNNRWVSCSFDGVDGYEMITIGPEAEHNQFVGCTFDCDINVDSGVENILFFPANYDRSIITNRAEDNSGVSQDMLTIFNEDGTVQQDTAILKLKHDDDGESNAKFLEMYDNAGADLKYSFGVDTLLNGDGNVGIGTASPAAKLNVVGDQILSGALTLSNVGEAIYSPAQGYVVTESRGSVAAVGDTNDNGASDSVIFQVSQGETYGNLLTANKLLTVTKDGRMGLGDISPDAALGVVSTTASDDILKLRNDADAVELIVDTEASKVHMTAGSGESLSLGANATKQALTVTTGGNVGIGTVTANAKLEVEGNIIVDQKIQAQDSGGLEFATDEGTTRMAILDAGSINLFDGYDVADDANGNVLYLRRDAAEGDTYAEMYVNQYRNFVMNTVNGSSQFGGNSIYFYPGSGSISFGRSYDEANDLSRFWGYITSSAASRYVQYKVDAGGEYQLTRQDDSITEFAIAMPVTIDGDLSLDSLTFTDGTSMTTAATGTGGAESNWVATGSTDSSLAGDATIDGTLSVSAVDTSALDTASIYAHSTMTGDYSNYLQPLTVYIKDDGFDTTQARGVTISSDLTATASIVTALDVTAKATGQSYGTISRATGTGSNYAMYLLSSGGTTNYGLYSASGNNYMAEQLEVNGNIILDQKLQAQDAGGLELATDEGTTRIAIADDGNVGIGVAAPGAALEVATDVIINDDLSVDEVTARNLFTTDLTTTGIIEVDGNALVADNDDQTLYVVDSTLGILCGLGANLSASSVTLSSDLSLSAEMSVGSNVTINENLTTCVPVWVGDELWYAVLYKEAT